MEEALNRIKATLAMLVLGGAMVATAPAAQAQSCGLRYVEGSNQPDKNAARWRLHGRGHAT